MCPPMTAGQPLRAKSDPPLLDLIPPVLTPEPGKPQIRPAMISDTSVHAKKQMTEIAAQPRAW
jgi:hypothetical protein